MAKKKRKIEERPVTSIQHKLILGIGMFVGVAILGGAVYTIVRITTWGNVNTVSTSPQDETQILTQELACTKCLSLKNNNQTVTVPANSQFGLELPAGVYPQKNLKIIANPTGAVVVTNTIDQISVGSPKNIDWVKTFSAGVSGEATLIVNSNQGSVSDFQVAIVIK